METIPKISKIREMLTSDDWNHDENSISWEDICSTINDTRKNSISNEHREIIYLLIVEHFFLMNIQNDKSYQEIISMYTTIRKNTIKRCNLPFGGKTITAKFGARYNVEDLPVELRTIIRRFFYLITHV